MATDRALFEASVLSCLKLVTSEAKALAGEINCGEKPVSTRDVFLMAEYLRLYGETLGKLAQAESRAEIERAREE